MSRDVSPEVCGWCGVEMPCGCDDDVGGFDDVDGGEDHETERALNRGTSACDGSCAPMCDWCLVSHSCPDDCGGGDGCPYRALAERDTVPREPGCQCQWEVGDSPCQVHGEDEQ